MKLIWGNKSLNNYLFLQLNVGEKKKTNHYVFHKLDLEETNH